MAELVTTGVWMVTSDKEAAFVEAWASFAAWAGTHRGAGELRLGRDTGEPRRFVSYGAWEGAGQVRAWKSSPEFRERMAHVLQYVDDFRPTELDVVATSTAGTSPVTARIVQQGS